MGMIDRLLRIVDSRVEGSHSDPTLHVTVDTGEWFDIKPLTDDGRKQFDELLKAVGIVRIVNAHELIGRSFGRRALKFHHFKAITKLERQQDSAQQVASSREALRLAAQGEQAAEQSADAELEEAISALEARADNSYDRVLARILRLLFEAGGLKSK